MSTPPRRHLFVAALVRALVALARALPPAVAVRAGACVGVVAWALSAPLRALGDANLARVFPHWTQKERARTLRACARWLGAAGAEALAVAYGQRHPLACVGVSPAAREALAPCPRGIVLATGHLGNWELLGAVLAALGHETHAVVRRPRNEGVAGLVTSLRARMGFREIPRGPHAALHAARALRRGGVVGLLCDQASDQSSAWVPFLGSPAPTPLGPALLARRTGAALVVAWLHREGPFRYTLECARVDAGTDDTVTMTEVNDLLGVAIRARPEAWVWFHTRWTAPPRPAPR